MTPAFLREYNRGLRQAQRWYLLALSCQIRDEPEDAEEAWERFEAAVADAVMLASLSGQSATYAKAKQAGMPQKAQDWPEERPETFAAPSAEIRPGQFWEAVRGFRRRVPLGWLEVMKLRAKSKRLAEKIRRTESQSALRKLRKQLVALEDVLRGNFTAKGATPEQAARLKSLLADAVENQHLPKGLRTGGLSKFIRRAQAEGIMNMSAVRLETVYRTNISSVYNEAAYDILKKPGVRSWAPLLRLVEVHDSRTRGAPGGEYKGKQSRNPGHHWQMNGYIETPERMKSQNLIPPNGFNCRGAVVAVTVDEAIRLKIADKNGNIDQTALNRYNSQRQKLIDKGLYPDPGFKR